MRKQGISIVFFCREIEWLGEDEYKAFYKLLSQQRQQKLDKYCFFKDKRLGMLTYLLLQYALYSVYGIICKPEFVYGKYEKPYINGEADIHFNLSHCEYGVACGISDEEIGIDIQEVVTFEHNVANMVMNESEMNLIRDSNEKDIVFTQLWAQKEAYVKYEGTGIGDNLMQIDFSGYSDENMCFSDCIVHTYNLDNIMIAMCCERQKDKVELKEVKKADLLDFCLSMLRK